LTLWLVPRLCPPSTAFSPLVDALLNNASGRVDCGVANPLDECLYQKLQDVHAVMVLDTDADRKNTMVALFAMTQDAPTGIFLIRGAPRILFGWMISKGSGNSPVTMARAGPGCNSNNYSGMSTLWRSFCSISIGPGGSAKRPVDRRALTLGNPTGKIRVPFFRQRSASNTKNPIKAIHFIR
jgi:hypothetical protein